MKAIVVVTSTALLLALSGCAINIVAKAPDDQRSDDTNTIVTGRMNYVVEGKTLTPYGAFRPAWPAPFMNAVSLQTGEVHAFPAVADDDGQQIIEIVSQLSAYFADRLQFLGDCKKLEYALLFGNVSDKSNLQQFISGKLRRNSIIYEQGHI